jgi:hypothetical protein
MTLLLCHQNWFDVIERDLPNQNMKKDILSGKVATVSRPARDKLGQNEPGVISAKGLTPALRLTPGLMSSALTSIVC